MNEWYQDKLAQAALEIGAIKLNPSKPFQWASGYRMPIYNDNRMFLGFPEFRKFIAEGFQDYIIKEGIKCDIIAGTSTAGIPHASILACELDLPMIYVRDKPKSHGLQNQIEGIDADKDLDGKKVLLIEDLVSTGGSSVRAVEAIRNANGECNYCFSIFDYGMEKANEIFGDLDPACHKISLITYENLMQAIVERGYFNEDEVKLLKEWKEDPFNWGEKNGFPKVEK